MQLPPKTTNKMWFLIHKWSWYTVSITWKVYPLGAVISGLISKWSLHTGGVYSRFDYMCNAELSICGICYFYMMNLQISYNHILSYETVQDYIIILIKCSIYIVARIFPLYKSLCSRPYTQFSMYDIYVWQKECLQAAHMKPETTATKLIAII